MIFGRVTIEFSSVVHKHLQKSNIFPHLQETEDASRVGVSTQARHKFMPPKKVTEESQSNVEVVKVHIDLNSHLKIYGLSQHIH